METEDPEKQRTKTIWSSVGKEDLNKNMLPIVDVSCRIFFYVLRPLSTITDCFVLWRCFRETDELLKLTSFSTAVRLPLKLLCPWI